MLHLLAPLLTIGRSRRRSSSSDKDTSCPDPCRLRPARSTKVSSFFTSPLGYVASRIWNHRPLLHPSVTPIPAKPTRIVCIADTCGETPGVDSGDIFIHAGNLTRHGTWLELQRTLNWINGLPHQFKIVVAGPNDLILDHEYGARVKKSIQHASLRAGIDWGNIVYLENDYYTVKWPNRNDQLIIWGSPLSPRGKGPQRKAFEYDPAEDVWSKWSKNRPLQPCHIMVTHTAPRGHMDGGKGCPHLTHLLQRQRPNYHIFNGSGNQPSEEHLRFDAAQTYYEKLVCTTLIKLSSPSRLVKLARLYSTVNKDLARHRKFASVREELRQVNTDNERETGVGKTVTVAVNATMDEDEDDFVGKGKEPAISANWLLLVDVPSLKCEHRDD